MKAKMQLLLDGGAHGDFAAGVPSAIRISHRVMSAGRLSPTDRPR
jgi:hypothetical protein